MKMTWKSLGWDQLKMGKKDNPNDVLVETIRKQKQMKVRADYQSKISMTKSCIQNVMILLGISRVEAQKVYAHLEDLSFNKFKVILTTPELCNFVIESVRRRAFKYDLNFRILPVLSEF